MHARNPRLGLALVVTGALLFGLNGGVSRIALRGGVPSEDFTSLRITGAALVLALIALLTRRSALRVPRGRSALLIVGLGLIGVVSLQWTYNIAIDRLPLGTALLLEYLAPVLVVLWVRFGRREPVHDRMWAAVALSVCGIAAVGQVWDGMVLDGLGVVMALAAAVSLATYYLLGEHHENHVEGSDPLHVILWAFLVATVVMNVVSPVWTAPSLAGDASMLGRLDGGSLPLWLVMGCVVVLGTVAPFFLTLLALRHIPATLVTVVAMLEPVIAVLLGWAWFTEALSVFQVLGVVAVLAGILLAQTARTRQPAALPQP